jgi:hypothetical protein
MSDWHDTWVAELDRLELTLAEAEALLRSNDPPVVPSESPAWQPQARGVLPEDLLPRARLVHERQLALAHALAERALRTHQHSQLARVIRDSTMRPEIPVYLDISA